jgi:hypothetical protein
MREVLILNPAPGGATRVSGRRAARMYRKGRADVTANLELIFRLSPAEIQRREEERIDRELARYHRGVVGWNGSGDPDGMKQPGRVRS